jgi:hypothetical protein
MQGRLVLIALKSRGVRTALLCALVIVLCLPVIVAGGIVGLMSAEGQAESGCAAPGITDAPAGGGAPAAGLYAEPLQLVPGHWYEVGATEYGGPNDTAGSYGSIPSPGESYLPSHPDSFAELSLLDSNPANGGGALTFEDANALSNLAYLSQLRVWHAGREALLAKRDTGYGQGPGQEIPNGQPYRIDVWWQAAERLGISKSAVRISLTPPSGAGATLEALPSSSEASAGSDAAASCPGDGALNLPLPLTPGTQSRILPSGLAAAGEEAPTAVKQMVAAGNRLYGTSYLYGGAHGTSLDTRQPAYDCSSAVSYVLHGGRVLGSSALDSSALESYGRPGPGRFVSIYSNPGHTFIYVAGLRFDTVEAPTYDSGPNSGKSGARWRVSSSVPGWASWVVRHPPGL